MFGKRYKKLGRLYFDLGRLTKAGFTLGQGLGKLRFKERSDFFERWAGELEDIAREPDLENLDMGSERGGDGGLSGLERGAVACGVSSGNLDEAFRHLGEYYSTLHSVVKGFASQMVYPIFLAFFAAFAFNVKFLFGANVSGVGRFFGFAGNYFVTLFFLLLVAGVIFGVVIFLLKKVSADVGVERFVRSVPYLGNLWVSLVMFRFVSFFDMFWSSGVSLARNLKLSAEASDSPLVRSAGGEMAGRLAREGCQLSELFSGHVGVFPEDFVDSLVSAEESGEIAESFSQWSLFYKEEFVLRARSFAGFMAKLFSLLIMLFIGYKIVMFYVGRWSMYSDILDNI